MGRDKQLGCLKAYAIIFSLIFITTVTGSVLAQTEATAPDAIQNFIATIKSINFSETSDNSKKITEANAYLDLESMTQRALEAHWDRFSQDQRQTFMELMWQLIEAIAYPQSQKFFGDLTISYPETIPIENGFEVKSVVNYKDRSLDAEVVYRLKTENGQWKIYDVILDDISIVEDLSYQFNKIIEQSSVDGLLERMREKLAEAESEPGSGSV